MMKSLCRHGRLPHLMNRVFPTSLVRWDDNRSVRKQAFAIARFRGERVVSPLFTGLITWSKHNSTKVLRAKRQAWKRLMETGRV